MKRVVCIDQRALLLRRSLAARCRRRFRRGNRQRAAPALVDWVTDGNDNQRTGWQRERNDPHEEERQEPEDPLEDSDGQSGQALHSLMPVLIIGRLLTPPNGSAQVGIVNGISDNLYAVRRRVGHDPVAEALGLRGRRPRRRRAAAAADRRSGAPRVPAPGGSSDTPVIGPADAQGRRPVYFVTGDGMLHIVNAADGERSRAARTCSTSAKGWSLNLVGNVLWMANTYAGDHRSPR